MIGNAVLTTDPNGGYVAHDPTTGTTSQGDDMADALAILREAVGLYLEEFPMPTDRALGGGPHRGYAGAMNDLTKFLDPEIEQWMETRIAECEFATVEEYLASLIRRDREEAEEETEWLREQIDIGRASGVIDKDAKEVLREIIAELDAEDG